MDDDGFLSQKTKVAAGYDQVDEVKALLGGQSMAQMTTQGVTVVQGDQSTTSPSRPGGSKMTGIEDSYGINFGAGKKSPRIKDDYEDLLDNIEKDFGGIGFDSEQKNFVNTRKRS